MKILLTRKQQQQQQQQNQQVPTPSSVDCVLSASASPSISTDLENNNPNEFVKDCILDRSSTSDNGSSDSLSKTSDCIQPISVLHLKDTKVESATIEYSGILESPPDCNFNTEHFGTHHSLKRQADSSSSHYLESREAKRVHPVSAWGNSNNSPSTFNMVQNWMNEDESVYAGVIVQEKTDSHISPLTTLQKAPEEDPVAFDDPIQEDEPKEIEICNPVIIEISGSSASYSRTQCPEDIEYSIEKEAEIETISRKLNLKKNSSSYYPCGGHKAIRCSDNLQNFLLELRNRGLQMVIQEGDGNCLFRAISLQVYGDSDQHGEIRRKCIDYMEKEKEHFTQFINDESFDLYILRKRKDGVHGNNLEIQALSELFNRPVEVFVPENGASPINIFHTDYKTTDVPIRLSYHDGNHYNAIVDPLLPTAGLGLGLPGLEPGLADRLQLQQAKDESDQLHVRKVAEESYRSDLQRAIKESKLSAAPINSDYNSNLDVYTQQKLLALSDWEDTNSELEQAAIQNSMESFWSGEQNRKQSWSHSQRRRYNLGNKSHVRTGSPPYHNDNLDRGRPISQNHFTPSTTCIESPRLSNMIQVGQPQHGDSTDVDTPQQSSSYASSIPAVSSVAYEEPQPDFIDSSVEYPQTVQELVVNGFELAKVLRAYELIGDNFDDMLSFLLSQA